MPGGKPITLDEASNWDLFKAWGWGALSQVDYSVRNAGSSVADVASAVFNGIIGAAASVGSIVSPSLQQTAEARLSAAKESIHAFKSDAGSIISSVSTYKAANLAAQAASAEHLAASAAQTTEQKEREDRIETAKLVASAALNSSTEVTTGVISGAFSVVLGCASWAAKSAYNVYVNHQNEKEAAKKKEKEEIERKNEAEVRAQTENQRIETIIKNALQAQAVQFQAQLQALLAQREDNGVGLGLQPQPHWSSSPSSTQTAAAPASDISLSPSSTTSVPALVPPSPSSTNSEAAAAPSTPLASASSNSPLSPAAGSTGTPGTVPALRTLFENNIIRSSALAVSIFLYAKLDGYGNFFSAIGAAVAIPVHLFAPIVKEKCINTYNVYRACMNRRYVEEHKLRFAGIGAAALTSMAVTAWNGNGIIPTLISPVIVAPLLFENGRKVAKACLWGIDKNDYKAGFILAFRFSVLSSAAHFLGYSDYSYTASLVSSAAIAALAVKARSWTNHIIKSKNPLKKLFSVAVTAICSNPPYRSLKGYVWTGRVMAISALAGYASYTTSIITTLALGSVYFLGSNIKTKKA